MTDTVLNVVTFGAYGATKHFIPGGDDSMHTDAINQTQDQEDKAAADESEAELRRRRRGMLRRVYTSPGSQFVAQSNIGKNTLTGA